MCSSQCSSRMGKDKARKCMREMPQPDTSRDHDEENEFLFVEPATGRHFLLVRRTHFVRASHGVDEHLVRLAPLADTAVARCVSSRNVRLESKREQRCRAAPLRLRAQAYGAETASNLQERLEQVNRSCPRVRRRIG